MFFAIFFSLKTLEARGVACVAEACSRESERRFRAPHIEGFLRTGHGQYCKIIDAPAKILMATLVAAVLGGCGTSREQPPIPNANVVAAPEAAQPIANETKARHAITGTAPSPEALSKKITAAILSQIHQANLKEIAIGKVAEGKASQQRGSSLRGSTGPGSYECRPVGSCDGSEDWRAFAQFCGGFSGASTRGSVREAGGPETELREWCSI